MSSSVGPTSGRTAAVPMAQRSAIFTATSSASHSAARSSTRFCGRPTATSAKPGRAWTLVRTCWRCLLRNELLGLDGSIGEPRTSMPDRYYVAEPITAEHARLVGEEAHHLLHVMRARAGDELVVFDGSGAEWQGRGSQIDRNAVDVALLARREIDRELSFELTLATALPKGDRQRWLVEKAVELGVRRLTPLVTERGVAQPTDKALTRLRRAVIEASKQCGRNRLMEVSQPVVFFDY